MTKARATTVLLSTLALAACASSGGKPQPAPTAPVVSAPQDGRPAFRVRDVMGKSPQELDRQFGAPSLVRREGPGEYRRYTLKTCQLIVILYPDDDGARTAGHVESAAKSARDPKPDVASCLARG